MQLKSLDKTAENRINAKIEIIRLWTEFEKNFVGGKTLSKAFFCSAYNLGHIEAPTWAKQTIRTISQASLMRWARQITQKDLARLAGKYGNRKNSGVFYTNHLLQDYVFAMINTVPHCTARMILRGISVNLQLFKLRQPPSLKTVTRFMGDWNAQARSNIEKNKNVMELK